MTNAAATARPIGRPISSNTEPKSIWIPGPLLTVVSLGPSPEPSRPCVRELSPVSASMIGTAAKSSPALFASALIAAPPA